MSFAALGAAQEQRLVRAQTAAFLQERLAQLVEAGAAHRSSSAAAATALFVEAGGVPTTVTRSRPAAEVVYQHVKSAVPSELEEVGMAVRSCLAVAEGGRVCF